MIAPVVDEIKSRGSSCTRKGQKIADAICAFDIEVYSNPRTQRGEMYMWQFCCEEIVVIGRTWEQYIAFQQILQDIGMLIVVYVHNLAYEFQFLAGRFKFDEVFAVKERKPLRARCGNIEYRCSYKLSNLSLEKTAERYNKVYFKESGDLFDYNKPRTSETPLEPIEISYGANDVLAVVEYIHTVLDRDGDTLKTIPMTVTGYVRRDAKHALRYRRRQLANLTPDPEVYIALREAFRGGNTHANRYMSGRILRNVKSADRSSSYPDVLCNEKYPLSPFRRVDAKRWRRYFRRRSRVLNENRHNGCIMQMVCHCPVPECIKMPQTLRRTAGQRAHFRSGVFGNYTYRHRSGYTAVSV